MDTWRKQALVSLESDLKANLSLAGLLSRLERPAGGFMTEDERRSVEEAQGKNNQVGKIIEVLRGKGNRDFDAFLNVLRESGNELWAEKLDEESARQFEEYHNPIGSDATVGVPFSVPDIRAEYVEVKQMFVKVCTTQGSPTLDEVKDHCIDLIEGANIPRISHHEKDIEKAETMNELARVVCFRLSKWVSYDFFRKVIAHFQPALASVKQQLMQYEDQLKPFLLQKLEYIAELRQQEEVPGSLAELTVRYKLDADGLHVKDLVTERDFLAQRLGIPDRLLQVLSWGIG